MNHIFDTNILLEDPYIIERYENVIIPSAILEEINGLKKSESLGHKARMVNRVILNNIETIKFDVRDYYSGIPDGENSSKRDNNIIMSAKKNNALLFSNDIYVIIKARSLGVEYCLDDNTNECYKGYKRLKGDTAFINDLFASLSEGNNEYGFIINEYLILDNTDLNKTLEFRFDGKNLVDLKLPSSKVVKGLNPEQRCALDLLNNSDIGIKIITGLAGSGKTYLTTKIALNQVVDKGAYKCLTYLRNPTTLDGTDIGFLKGDKSDKIYEHMKPILQYIHNEKDQFYVDTLINNEMLKLDVISYLKGINLDDSFVICDEAEDLTLRLLKMIGSRIAKKACVAFIGDIEQSEKRYKFNNGLVKAINVIKGNSNVGVMHLPEDLRSDISRIFAEIVDN